MPQAAAYYPDGTPIPEEQLGDAVQSGQANFEEGARVHVRTSDGKAGTVDASEVAQMLEAGGSIEAPSGVAAQEQAAAKAEALAPYSGIAQQYIQYQESLANAATFGGYAVAARAVAPEYADDMQKRREAMPVSTAYADVVGAGGALVYGGLAGGGAVGGTGALARLSQAISAPGRAVVGAGRGAAALAGGGARALGFEGLTAGGRIGEAALRLGAAGAAEGGLMGVGQAASDAALHDQPITIDKLLAGGKHGAILGGVSGAVLGGGGQAGKEILKHVIGGKTFGEAVSDFAERRAFKSVVGNARKFYDKAGEAGVNRIGRKMLDRGVPLSSVDDAVGSVRSQLDDASARMRGVADSLDVAGTKVDVRKVLAAVDDQVAKLRSVELADFQTVARKVERQMGPLRKSVDAGKEYSFSDFWKLRQDLDKTIKWSARQGNPSTDALRDLRRTVDDGLTETVEASAGRETAAVWKAAKEDYHDFNLVDEALEDLTVRTEKNRFLSASDYGTGALGFLGAITGGSGAVAGLISGAVTSHAHKLVREKGPGVVARIADTIAKTDKRLAATAAAIASGERKTLPQLPEPIKFALPGAITEAKDAPGPGVPKAPSPFTARVAQLYAFQAQPQQSYERLGKAFAAFAGEYPEMATALMARVQGDVDWLTSQLPRPQTRAGATLTPQAVTPNVPRVMQVKFMQQWDALEQPEAVMQDVAKGNLNRHGIEALKARRPDLWNEMRTRVQTELAHRGDEVPYKRRILLSLAFDLRGDKSLMPEMLASIQATHGSLMAPPEESAPGPQSSTDVSPKLADDYATTTQRLAAGG